MSTIYLVTTAALSLATIGVGLYAYTNMDAPATQDATDVRVEAKVRVDYIEDVRNAPAGESEDNNKFLAVIATTLSKNKKDMKSKMNQARYEELKRFALDAERSNVTSDTVDMNAAVAACAIGLWGVSNVLAVTTDTCDPYTNACDPQSATLYTFDQLNRSYVVLVKSKPHGEHISCVVVDDTKQLVLLFGTSALLPNDFLSNLNIKGVVDLKIDPKKPDAKPNDASKADALKKLKEFASYTVYNQSGPHKEQYPSHTDIYTSGAWSVFSCLAFSKNKAGMAARNSATPFNYNKFVADIDIKLFWEKVMEGFKLFGEAKEADPPKKKETTTSKKKT
jgi:hypothetical protein